MDISTSSFSLTTFLFPPAKAHKQQPFQYLFLKKPAKSTAAVIVATHPSNSTHQPTRRISLNKSTVNSHVSPEQTHPAPPDPNTHPLPPHNPDHRLLCRRRTIQLLSHRRIERSRFRLYVFLPPCSLYYLNHSHLAFTMSPSPSAIYTSHFFNTSTYPLLLFFLHQDMRQADN